MRVPVTGSSGLLGSTIADLLRSAHDVVGIDLLPGPHTTLVASVSGSGAVAKAMRGCDAVVDTTTPRSPPSTSTACATC